MRATTDATASSSSVSPTSIAATSSSSGSHAASDPAVRFAGFEAWEGHAAAIADPVEKRRAVAAAVEQLTGTAAMCRARGIPVSIVSCGGTATYPITVALPGVTEIQAGGGIFADVRCRDTLHLDLACALTVLTTVTSRPTPLRIVCDAGKKSMSNDLGQPEPIAVPKMRSMRLSAEHTILELVDASETPRIGERIGPGTSAFTRSAARFSHSSASSRASAARPALVTP